MSNLPSLGLLLQRVGFGLFMALGHGFPKLMKFGELSGKFASFLPTPTVLNLSLALVGELICPLLIIAGLFTRYAGAFASATMLVAAFGAHGDSPFKEGEHALLFAIGFAAIALTGPGPLSVDVKVRKRSG